ncbi:putative cysteinyl-trna synthetase [Phaeomoniella chlamydospora]|uniref:cysteine--tRNA ligase n=1 Tax=Phaeomoniella chlamydospora TaxID=158046 RepID=A0A0G2H636_PHACM|nr:putative cysteinyl-trna synthetase [Phaeomoniella chlamydospora]
MATQARQQPPWTQPKGATKHPRLKVYNSLTRSKVPFLTCDPKGESLTWYACGPTVYDDAHLGHARNYVSTDILRRILRDYFGFKVNFVMNITDVDDKIILRGRQQFLLERYRAQHQQVDEQVLQDVSEAYAAYVKKNLPLINEAGVPSPDEFREAAQKAYGMVLKGESLSGEGRPGDKEAKIKMHINTVTAATDVMAKTSSTADVFYPAVADLMAPHLDSKEGSSVSSQDHSIWNKLTKEFEDRFFRDVRELNVMDPDTITRVTEYGKQIADFVDRIVANNFGYATSDGSVYFDIDAFEKAGNPYARLEPWNKGDKELQADGEGALTQKTSQKRSDADFALWKASKPGEPSWSSPWGQGRPGWHIECSAMASAKLGRQMDIHSGGIDLAFPHHDNELAQSEAYWQDGQKEQWVNYFLHMGHLSIQGSKMSKSLKNFTTIRKALDRGDWTPRSLRIVFLLGGWKDGIEITDELVTAGSSWEDKLNNFFLKTKDIKPSPSESIDSTSDLGAALKLTEESIYEALCDSFNTPVAMAAISNLITKYNAAEKGPHSTADVVALALYITKMVNVFGLNGNAPATPETIGWTGMDIPEEAKQPVYALSTLRDSLREAARSKQSLTAEGVSTILSTSSPSISEADARNPYVSVLEDFKKSASQLVEKSDLNESVGLSKEILSLCDRVRDIDLWNLSIYLEDAPEPSQPALVRPVTKELLAAREEREERAREKQAAKEKREKEAREREEKGRLDPKEMFKLEGIRDDFSEWDTEGMPTKDKDGKELPKSRVKKLKKDWDRQKKAHETWLASNQGKS